METWDTKVKKVLRKFGKNKTSFHLKKVLSKSLKIPNYDVCQDEETITISVHISGIENHASDMIQAVIQPMSIELKVTDLNSLDYFLKIRRLSYEIVCKKSSIKMEPGVLHFILHKTRPWLWNSLYYHNPKCIANFRSKVADLRANPVFEHKTDILLDLWGIEKLSESGRHVRDILQQHNIAVPHSVKTIDDIIGHMKMTLDVDSNNENFRIFAAVVYMKQKLEIEISRRRRLSDKSTSFDLVDETEATSDFVKRKAIDLNWQGVDNYEDKNYYEAVKAFSQAVDLQPRFYAYYKNKAIAHYKCNQMYLCANNAALAISLKQFYAEAYLYLGKCFIALYLIDEAIEYLYQAKFLDPDNIDIESHLPIALDLNHYQDMLIKAVQVVNEKKKEKYFKTIMRLVKRYYDHEHFGQLDHYGFCMADIRNSIIYFDVMEQLITSLCERNLIAYAQTEAAKCIRPFSEIIFPIPDREIFHYFKSLCSYYKDNEVEYIKIWKLYKNSEYYSLLYEKFNCKINEIYTARRKGDDLYDKNEFEDSIFWYNSAIENSFVTPLIASKLCYKIGCAKAKLNEDKEAIFYFTLAINFKCEYHEAFCERGILNLKQNKRISARQDFQRAFAILPCNRYQELKETAERRKLFIQCMKEMDTSENKFKKKISICKKERGNNHFKSKRFLQAIQSYSEAITLDSTNAMFYCNRAACHIKLKNFIKGAKDSEKGLKIDPAYVKGYYRLGQCHIALGKPDEALLALGEGLKINRKSNIYLLNEIVKARYLKEDMLTGNNAYKEEMYKAAESYFSFALQNATACVDLYLNRAECLIYLGEFDKAFSVASFVRELCSLNNSRVNYIFGLWQFHSSWQKPSFDYFELSLEENPFDEQVSETFRSLKFVTCLKDLGSKLTKKYKEDALLCYRECLKQKIKNRSLNSYFYCCIGMILLDKEEIDLAIDYFSDAIVLDSSSYRCFKGRGDCFLLLHQFENALEDFQCLYKLEPTEENRILAHYCKSKLKMNKNQTN